MNKVAKFELGVPVLLAPMAGITDLPFRTAVAAFGAGFLFSEMVASREMATAGRDALRRSRLDGAADIPTAVQIAGRDAHWMAEAARLCEAGGAPLIDINMGCPAKKVTSGWSGAALMREPDHALSLIEAVVNAVSVPVSLKMRLGWDDTCLNAADLARMAEASGVVMVTVHGRTRAQFYKGRADWHAVRTVRDAIRIPLVVNGDIVDGPSARAALDHSGADAVMVGRGAQGAPWRLREIAESLRGEDQTPPPQGMARVDVILAHHEHVLRHYGRELGGRIFRKHLAWYCIEMGRADLRPQLVRAEQPDDVARILRNAVEHPKQVERAA